MIPAPVTDEMVQQFGSPLEAAVKRTFVGPEDLPNVEPCEAIVERSRDGVTAVMRVPMQLEPGDLTTLLKGGTLWVTMWGGLSPFAVEVVPTAGDDGSQPHAQKELHRRETEAKLLAAPPDPRTQDGNCGLCGESMNGLPFRYHEVCP